MTLTADHRPTEPTGDNERDTGGFTSIAAVVGGLFALTAAGALVIVIFGCVDLVEAFNRGASDLALASKFLNTAQAWGVFLACALGMVIARGMSALVTTSRR